MARIEKSIEIATPAEKVWPMLYWDRLPDWMELINSGKYTSKEKYAVGAAAHVTSEAVGIKAEYDVEITEYVENKRAAWRTTAGNLTAIGQTILKSTEKGTKLTFIIDYELPYSILGRIIDKIRVSKDTAKSMEKSLKKLKTLLEK